MSYGKVVRRKISGLSVAIDEGSVGIAKDLPVPVILHHDHEHVV